MNLLLTLLHSKWAIERGYAENAGPMLYATISSGMEESDKVEVQSFMRTANSAERIYSASEANAGDILLMEIDGPMTRKDQWCGPAGSETIASQIDLANSEGKVKAIIMVLATPGGQVSGTELLANTIAASKIPIYAYVKYAYSAGYWVASQCKEIWMESKTAGVGSIGTMLSFADMRGYWAKNGVNFHEIYASKSVDKNAAFAEAREGKYERMITQELDPINEVFIGAVRNARNLDDAYMTGNTYLAEQAIQNGMADRIGTMRELIDYINAKHMSEKSLLGRLFGAVKTEEDATNLANEVGALQAQCDDLSAKLVEANKTIEAQKAEIATAKDSLATLENQVAEWKSKAESFGSQPGAVATSPKRVAAEGVTATLPTGFDPSAEHNKLAMQMLRK